MDTLIDGSTHIPVNREEFPDGAKRGNRARRHHVGGQNDVSAPCRVANGTRGKEKHSETSSFALRKAAKRATRGDGPLNSREEADCATKRNTRGERETGERKRRQRRVNLPLVVYALK